MRKPIKHIAITFIVSLLLMLFCVSASAAEAGISRFTVEPLMYEEQVNSSKINWYYNASDGKYYLFMPSSADLAALPVDFEASGTVTCGDAVLTAGETTNVFAGGGEFQLSCDGQQYTLVVVQSQDISTVFIDTESGSLEAVHADKEHKESGTALIYDQDGEVEYDGELDYIKGRGNTTWTADKKPYNIKLEDGANLFGMGKSKRWSLLSNRSDGSLIRNQLSLQLAEKIDVPYTSGHEQFNFYVNGEYQGVYLMTEKVEINDDRIEIFDLEAATEDVNEEDLDSYTLGGAQKSMVWNTVKYAHVPNNPENITGGYLLELEKIYRYYSEASGFISEIGQAVVVKEPEYASKAQVEYIATYYGEFEEALYSPTGYNDLGKHYSEYIDVDSLARMYILDEFTMNFDGCSSSFFLSKDIDGKLVAGPAWDFDLAFGCMAPNDLINHVPVVGDTNNLYIRTCFIGNHNEGKFGLLAQAYTHDDFQALVSEIWNTDFKDYYEKLLEKATEYGEDLNMGYMMDSIRWNGEQIANQDALQANHDNMVNEIRAFIERRYVVLDDAFAPDSYYLKYDVGDYAKSIIFDNTRYHAGDTAVVKADAVPNDTADRDYTYMRFAGWNTEPDGSGTSYATGDSITINGNTTLYAQWEPTNPFERLIQKVAELITRLFELIRQMFEMLAF